MTNILRGYILVGKQIFKLPFDWKFAVDIKQAFGKTFAKARKSAKLVQDDFEQVSSRSYISYIERGKVSISLEKLDELSEVVGVHPVSLLFQTYLSTDKDNSALDLMSRIMADLKRFD